LEGSQVLLQKNGALGDHPPFWQLPQDEYDGNDDLYFENPQTLLDKFLNLYLKCAPASQLCTKEQLAGSVRFLGRQECTSFGVRRCCLARWILTGPVAKLFRDSLSHSCTDFLWQSASDVVSAFTSWTSVVSPETLQLMKTLIDSRDSVQFCELVGASCESEHSAFLKLQFAPNIQCIPILSNTLKPFAHTNLVMVESGSDCLIVDPGASAAGADVFRQVLETVSSRSLKVFITHHHKDHWEGLHLVEELFPNAVIIGHKRTLEKLSSTLKRQYVNGHDELHVGALSLQVLYAPGHTDGHCVLFHSKTRTLVAGDHLVGFGSAVLDFTCGDMSDYFETTRKFIALNPRLALPAHGPPNYTPVKLLHQYLQHRQERENSILAAVQQGYTTPESIVPIVYKDVDQDLWEWAKSNIALHLRKLTQEGRIASKM